PAADQHVGAIPEDPVSRVLSGHHIVLLHRRHSVNNSPAEVYFAALYGLFGYFASKWECEPGPLLLGFVLGPLIEENLRGAMLISRGDPSVFFTRPISLGMLIAAFALLMIIVLPQLRKKKEMVIYESAD